MEYYIDKLSDDCWGVYKNDQLLGTISCEKTCNEIVACLKSMIESEFSHEDTMGSYDDNLLE